MCACVAQAGGPTSDVASLDSAHPQESRPMPKDGPNDGCSKHAACGTARHAARLYSAECDSIGRVTPLHLLLVPIANVHLRTTAAAKSTAKPVAVLKLLNKSDSQDGMFSFVDENLVLAMARQAASALHMAQYVLPACAAACVMLAANHDSSTCRISD